MSQQLSTPSAPSGQPLALHLVEEISHRVINEYSEAIAILSLAAKRGHKSAGPAPALAADRLRAHAESHRALLAPLAGGRIDLGRHIGKLCASLARASLEEKRVRLSLSMDEIWIDSARCWRVGLITSELIRNAVRHGLRGGPGAIGVDIRKSGHWARCRVSDDGSAQTNPPEGRGRRLIRALAAELEGSVHWRFTSSGSIVELAFPILPPASLVCAAA